jgi:hypothetical protein
MRPGRYLLMTTPVEVISHGSEQRFTGMSYQTTGVIVSSQGHVIPISSPVYHMQNQNFRVKTYVDYLDDVEVSKGRSLIKVNARMRRFY